MTALSKPQRGGQKADKIQGERRRRQRAGRNLPFNPFIRLGSWTQHVGYQTVATFKTLLSSPCSPSIFILSCLTQSQMLLFIFSTSFLFGPVLFFLPIFRYPQTESLLWRSQTVANFSLFPVTLNTQQCSTHSSHCGQFKHVHVHTHSHMHACTNSYEMY